MHFVHNLVSVECIQAHFLNNMGFDWARSCYLRSQGQDDRAGPSWRDPGVESQWADEDVGLTFIGHQVRSVDKAFVSLSSHHNGNQEANLCK